MPLYVDKRYSTNGTKICFKRLLQEQGILPYAADERYDTNAPKILSKWLRHSKVGTIFHCHFAEENGGHKANALRIVPREGLVSEKMLLCFWGKGYTSQCQMFCELGLNRYLSGYSRRSCNFIKYAHLNPTTYIHNTCRC